MPGSWVARAFVAGALAVVMALLTGLVVLAPGVARAAPLFDLSSFSGNETVLTFNELPNGTLIDNEYTALGVTFSGVFRAANTTEGTIWPGSGPAIAENFQPCCADVTATFSPLVLRVGFYIITNEADDLTLTAYKGSNIVDVQTFDTHRRFGQPADFFGMEVPGGFDTLLIDVHGLVNGAFALDDFRFEGDNQPPDCSNAAPSVAMLWPPSHQMVAVTVNGVTDSDGDAVTIAITGITQDEPTNGLGDGDTSPDGAGVGTNTAQMRAERSGNGNGRVYHISFTADDGNGGTCSSMTTVGVPHSPGKKGGPVDDAPGSSYDSTLP